MTIQLVNGAALMTVAMAINRRGMTAHLDSKRGKRMSLVSRMATVDTPHAGNSYADSSNAGGNTSSISRGSARQGLQAQGEGFGQGFNQGFGQGLSGDPDGSQPHDGVHVQEDVGPGHASRDTDLVGDGQLMFPVHVFVASKGDMQHCPGAQTVSV